MRSTSIALGVVFLSLGFSRADVPSRDCYAGASPFCNNSLASDPACRGLNVTTIDGWKRMDCDYVLYNVPAPGRSTKKWLVIHAAGCDTFTGGLGDFFAPTMQLNLYGLRPCGGFQDSLCANRHDYDVCNALHISWYMPALHPTYAPYGLGFNPPALVDIFHTPGTTMLFLHQYGSTNTSYNWYSADGCNLTNKPLYMCLAGIDPKYKQKFAAIKPALEEAFSNSPSFGCRLEVIDSTPYAQDQDPAIPCTGILREYNDPAKVGGDVSGAPNWAWEMPGYMTQAVLLATQVEPDGVLVSSFRKAIDIALCKDFGDDGNSNGNGDGDGTACRDDDGVHGGRGLRSLLDAKRDPTEFDNLPVESGVAYPLAETIDVFSFSGTTVSVVAQCTYTGTPTGDALFTISNGACFAQPTATQGMNLVCEPAPVC